MPTSPKCISLFDMTNLVSTEFPEFAVLYLSSSFISFAADNLLDNFAFYSISSWIYCWRFDVFFLFSSYCWSIHCKFSSWSSATLAFTIFLIFFALYPNQSVDKVYSNWLSTGVAHSMIPVLEFPPRLVHKIFVSGEFLYGMWSHHPSPFREITWVKKNRLLLICFPSLTLSWMLLEI